MRSSTLALASISLVALAGAAVASAAVAEEIPAAYRTTASSPVIEKTVIMVQPGDTVYALGRRYGVKPTDIIALNDIPAPYHLAVGEEIILPQKLQKMAAPLPQPVSTGPISGQSALPASPAPLKKDVQMIQASATSAPTQLEYSTVAAVPEKLPPAVERLDAIYTVRPGDTMYSLSRRFEIGLEELAAANNVPAPYTLSVSQRLIIPGAMTAPETIQTETAPAPAEQLASLETSEEAQMAARELGVVPAVADSSDTEDNAILISKTGDSRFSWPIRGAIIEGYGTTKEGLRNDGINIAAPIGAPIRAAADGEVIYTGAELDGYGNLLLVRHIDGWVSAYAHTDSIMVKKGDMVRQGQVVAKVGRTGSVEAPQLHFELRHELQPRDPLAALEGRDIMAASYTQ
ncbi:peptidoglycan DD-metalloendopeptidase family protein [Parvularcula marina]|nr:M23 family metallopeptidase [Parvularcula marina]